MDNMKTGTLIKALRKEKGLTQQALADQLHITDRAVSKWERGICAPDIATLEPLAQILGVTVTELIYGEQMERTAQFQEVEEKVQNAIEYSSQEIKKKTSSVHKQYLAAAGVFVFLVAAVIWWGGYANIIARLVSPDGNHSITVYDRDVAENRFSAADAVTIRLSGSETVTKVYEDCLYGGLWWSPNSDTYVLQLDTHGETKLIMASVENGRDTDLSAALDRGVALNETAFWFTGGMVADNTDDLDTIGLKYEFVHWDDRGQTILIYYTFTDSEERLHDGYLRYDCGTGAVYISRVYVW